MSNATLAATIHFIYPRGAGIAAPFSIYREIFKRLSAEFSVLGYDWSEVQTIRPGNGDVLLGHPHPGSGTVFRNSFESPNWSKRIVMTPFSHGVPRYQAFLDPYIRAADHYLAICGRYWIDTITTSPMSHWSPKLEQVDLAVNLKDFPHIKREFNPAGQRRFLYIGSTGELKGTDVLASLGELNRDLEIGWCGYGSIASSRIIKHGIVDFSTESAQQLVSSYDFLLHMGRCDANPTTILEAAAWGLIPICTPQSGYTHEDWIVQVPLEDLASTSRTLQHLNSCEQSDLIKLQALAPERLRQHFNWERFYQQVRAALFSATRELSPNEQLLFQKREPNFLRMAAAHDRSLRRATTKARVRALFQSAARRLGIGVVRR